MGINKQNFTYMKIVLLGHMGRDEAVVDRLKEHKLYILGQWANPGLVEKAKASGGEFHFRSLTASLM